MTSTLRDHWLWKLLLLGLAVKIPMLWLNSAEYTDGLIQLSLFENGCPFYMPLFTALCTSVSALGLEPHMAGRSVSLLSHLLTIFPIHFIAVWLTGSRPAGRWSAALYLLSPVPSRWAIRVMTDSLFTLGWWTAIAMLLAAAPRLIGREREGSICPFRATAFALVAGALAALTRQTGWILLPPALLMLAMLFRRETAHALKPALAVLLWALPLWWMFQVGAFSGHGGQVEARFSISAAVVLLEGYALDWPLVLGWPVAILALWGLFRPIGTGVRWWWFVTALVWCVVGIMALQILIQSYLFRYLLPLVGFGCILAGGVLARLQSERPAVAFNVALIACVWLGLTTSSVLWLQRDAWGDARWAAEAMGEVAEEGTLCFANESYATWPSVGTAKAEYWSGREVHSLITPEGRMIQPPPGSLVLINSASTGPQGYTEMLTLFQQQLGAEVIGEWQSRLVPILPDIMDGSYPVGLHQNVLAIPLRHLPQNFRTALLRVGGAQ